MKNKFLNAVRSELIGRATPDFPFITVERENSLDASFTALDIYRMSVTWSRNMQYEPGQGQMAMRLFLEEFTDAVYGDLRSEIRDLKIAIFQQKRKDVEVILDNISEIMSGR